MNTQWMTTLFSKGIELEQNLRKGFESAQSQVKDQLKKELDQRGLRLNAADFSALLEEIAPGASRAALTGALEFFRPFTGGLGFRVSRLSDTQIEIVVPTRTRNKDEAGQLHEGVLLTAGIEAGKLLWARHAPLGGFESSVKSMSFELLKSTHSEVRVRMELLETARETTLAQLRQERQATSELALSLVDDEEQLIGQMNMTLLLRHTPALEQPLE